VLAAKEMLIGCFKIMHCSRLAAVQHGIEALESYRLCQDYTNKTFGFMNFVATQHHP